MVRCPTSGDLYVLNHLEYDADTLGAEYFRDADQGLETALPVNYFPDDNVSCAPVNSWRPFAYLLMANWLNDLYIVQCHTTLLICRLQGLKRK